MHSSQWHGVGSCLSHLRRLTRSIQMPRTCRRGQGKLKLPELTAQQSSDQSSGSNQSSGTPLGTAAHFQIRVQMGAMLAFMRAVSRCLDCSGLDMMTATWCVSSPCRVGMVAPQDGKNGSWNRCFALGRVTGHMVP